MDERVDEAIRVLAQHLGCSPLELEEHIRQAKEGGNMSAWRGFASGVEAVDPPDLVTALRGLREAKDAPYRCCTLRFEMDQSGKIVGPIIDGLALNYKGEPQYEIRPVKKRNRVS